MQPGAHTITQPDVFEGSIYSPIPICFDTACSCPHSPSHGKMPMGKVRWQRARHVEPLSFELWNPFKRIWTKADTAGARAPKPNNLPSTPPPPSHLPLLHPAGSAHTVRCSPFTNSCRPEIARIVAVYTA